MLTVFFAICIYGMAKHEKRRGWLWTMLYVLLSVGIQTWFVSGYWGTVLALFLSIALMTWANFKYPVNKGPFLK